jgi:tetratricopeptide (TPR) repeat protein
VHFCAGQAFYGFGKPEEAEEHLKIALDINPDNTDIYLF